jgi:hypothetical protein
MGLEARHRNDSTTAVPALWLRPSDVVFAHVRPEAKLVVRQSCPAFRTEILDLLNQGESVHSLERAIPSGGIGAKRGRTPEQMAAISGALSLLANIVMAWNTQPMPAVVRQTPAQFPEELVRQIAPGAHAYVNLRGIFTFAFGPHRSALLAPGRIPRARNVAG